MSSTIGTVSTSGAVGVAVGANRLSWQHWYEVVTAGQLAEMRSWLAECGMLSACPDREVVRLVEREYVGGVEAFLADCPLVVQERLGAMAWRIRLDRLAWYSRQHLAGLEG